MASLFAAAALGDPLAIGEQIGLLFAGNAVATVVSRSWVGEIDRAQVDRVLDGPDSVDVRTQAGVTR